MIGVLVVAMIFVVEVGGEFFTGGFFSEQFAMEGVSVGDVGVMSSGDCVIFFVSFSGEQMMLGSEFEMMSGFTMSMGGFFVEFVVVFGFFVVVVGHISVFSVF